MERTTEYENNENEDGLRLRKNVLQQGESLSSTDEEESADFKPLVSRLLESTKELTNMPSDFPLSAKRMVRVFVIESCLYRN